MSKFRIPIPVVDFRPPVYYCKKVDRPFKLTGQLDKEFWRDIPFTDEFIDIEGEHMPGPRFSTRVKMAWDDVNIYFGAVLEGEEIWAYVTEHDDVIFQDNDFEIFLDPDSDTQQYYEFEMNALNTTWDLFLPTAYRDGGSALNGYEIRGLQTAVHIDGGSLNCPGSGCRRWSLEVVIPFAAVTECYPGKAKPAPGDFYRLNFSRVQWLTDIQDGRYVKRISPETGRFLPEDNWVWAPTGVINIHYPELWGFLFFVDEGMTQLPSIPDDEYRKWELRKLYYAENIYFDLYGRYTDSLQTLKDILSEHSPVGANGTVVDFCYKVEKTSHGFEISAPSFDGQREIVIRHDGKVFSEAVGGGART